MITLMMVVEHYKSSSHEMSFAAAAETDLIRSHSFSDTNTNQIVDPFLYLSPIPSPPPLTGGTHWPINENYSKNLN